MNPIFLLLNLLPILFLYQLGGDFHMSVPLSQEFTLSLVQTHIGTFFAYLSLGSFLLVTIAQKTKHLSWSYYVLQFVLSIAMFVIVFAGDFITFFIGWEVMTWSSYFLISKSLNADMKSLQKYILFSLGSAFFLIAGMVITYAFTNTFDFATIASTFQFIPFSIKVTLVVLFSLSFFIKAGVIGLHYWVVDTYSKAPDLFSAILSAVMSKMGIYGLFLIYGNIVGFYELKEMFGSVLHGSSFGYVLAWIGVITSIIATFKAITQDEVKRLLAYSSIAQLGYIVAVIGLGTSFGVAGALYHTVIHTIIKLLLFINVAAIVAQSGKNKFSELGGLIYKTPLSFVMLLIGIISLAGMPPLGGFASKFMMYNALIDTKFALVLVAMLFSGAASFLYCYKLVYGIYLGHPNSKNLEKQKEVPLTYLIPQIILALALIGLGAFPGAFVTVINPILKELLLAPIPYSGLGVMQSVVGNFNGFFVISAFVIIFLVILLLMFRIKSKAKNNLNRFDISYCGEVPDKNTSLHYGYGMGSELHRIKFVNAILKRSTSNFYESLAQQTKKASQLTSRMYYGNIHNTAIIILLFFSALYFIGVNS
ncbi:proton-conducting transporter transmembrane domain-containing protein [Sulfurospirillum sp. 1612]|uniref:proton-conducting transporter transmembrane domain-containing protein n=1 Tax=Sulfurospirillum sp. 1612 TaxID=3094835 RepID=UPI002F92E4C6